MQQLSCCFSMPTPSVPSRGSMFLLKLLNMWLLANVACGQALCHEHKFHDVSKDFSYVPFPTTTPAYGTVQDSDTGSTMCGLCHCLKPRNRQKHGDHVYMYCEPKNDVASPGNYTVEFGGSLSNVALWLCVEPSFAHTVTKEFLPGKHLRVQRFLLTNSNVDSVNVDAFSEHYDDLEHIDLSDNKITDIDALIRSLTRLKSLRHLKLSGNRLVYLSKDLGSLHTIQSLELCDTSLSAHSTYIPRGSFPDRLEALDLSHNSFESIDFLSQHRIASLQRLSLSSCAVSEIPVGVFDQFKHLEELRLDSNSLVDSSIGQTDMFSHLVKLRMLNLSSNRLTRLDENAFSDVMLTLERNEQAEPSNSRFKVRLHVTNNQFVCDCAMEWWRTVGEDVTPKEKCSEPPEHRVYDIYNFPAASDCTSTALYIGIGAGCGIILIIIIALPVCIVIRKRKRRVTSVRPPPMGMPMCSVVDYPTTVRPVQVRSSLDSEKELTNAPVFHSADGGPNIYWKGVDEGVYYEVPTDPSAPPTVSLPPTPIPRTSTPSMSPKV